MTYPIETARESILCSNSSCLKVFSFCHRCVACRKLYSRKKSPTFAQKKLHSHTALKICSCISIYSSAEFSHIFAKFPWRHKIHVNFRCGPVSSSMLQNHFRGGGSYANLVGTRFFMIKDSSQSNLII